VLIEKSFNRLEKRNTVVYIFQIPEIEIARRKISEFFARLIRAAYPP